MLLAAICLLLAGSGRAQAALPTPAVKSTPSAMESDEADRHSLVMRYYHDRFFGEPWRLYGYYRIVEHKTAVILILDAGVGAALWRWSARRGAAKRSKP